MVGTWGLEHHAVYRVNFEVNKLKPFPHLAFPHFLPLQNAPKQPSFDG